MDDDDFPEMTEEIMSELRASNAVDLHLGPAQVKPRKRSWLEEHGPKPPGPGIHLLNILIVILGIANVYLILKVWIWMITT